MKLGYPCINLTIESKSSKTFRLKSFTAERFGETTKSNLAGLMEILEFNKENNFLFFRITSDLIPFGSHEVNTIKWQEEYKKDFIKIGDFIKENNMRVSMHPGQYVLLNSPREEVSKRSINDLLYHLDVLNLMGLDNTNKIQIHVGGAYGDKDSSINIFIDKFNELPQSLKDKLVIENDDRIYTVNDCYKIYEKTGIPILFDNFHHSINDGGLNMRVAALKAFSTWDKEDGIPMIDFSSQEPGRKIGNHSQSINIDDFKNFLELMKDKDFDIMLEIKDKDLSAIKAIKYIR